MRIRNDEDAPADARAFNPSAAVEMLCYGVFGVLLTTITVDGTYLSYVTPRLRPLLFLFAALTLVWAAMCARNVMSVGYRAHLERCLILLAPALLVAFPVAANPVDMIGPSSSGATSAVSNVVGGVNSAVGTGSVNSAVGTGGATGGVAADAPVGTDESGESIPGLDASTKTITVTDDTFYRWITAVSERPDLYDGYRISLVGFVYGDAAKGVAGGSGGSASAGGSFAVARMSMWCCPADTYLMGLLVDGASDASMSSFKEGDWVSVSGTLSADGDGIVVEPTHVTATGKPSVEYVYPN